MSMSSAPICSPTRAAAARRIARQGLSPAGADPAARRLAKASLLPTPMAIAQQELPIAALVYDAGRAARSRAPPLRPPAARPSHSRSTLDDDRRRALGDGYGHVELVYDFADGGEGDGWLHALFRYRHRASGHAAETSFGAHVFNTVLTYRGEPQSYAGRPPGLSTRLFLRLGEERVTTRSAI